MYRRKRGFTLVELLMVMGIIALIIALGVPIYSAMAMSRSLGGSAELINSSFLKYRSKATASGQPIFLVFEHWHMDPDVEEEDIDKLTPPKLQAFVVEYNEEVENNWEILEIDDPVRLPKGTWFNQYWVDHYTQNYSSISSNLTAYSEQANAICKNYYNMAGQNGVAGKLYMVIFLPTGHLDIIGGKDNIPGYKIDDDEDPDGDVWLTNGDDTILIDINPSTGRIRKIRYENAKYDKFQITD